MKTIKQLLITVAMLLCSVVANAYDFEVNGIYYNILSISELTVEVTNGDNEYSGDVVIQSTVSYKSKTLTVTSIGSDAFEACSSLTSITIPNSVTSIGYSAFKNCKGLTSIEIPNSVTSIGDYAFYKCSGLTNVVIGNSVTSIGESAFSDCSGLTSIVIPNSVTSIENEAFDNCKSLKDLRIEDGKGTLSLGYNANFGSGRGEGLFYDCPLETLYLGRDLSYNRDIIYGQSPFCYKGKLTSVTIGNSVTSIGDYAFYKCSGLTNVVIGNSVTSIGESAFSDCSGLTSIVIPNSVTSIEYKAFYNCESLTNVVIGNSVTSIGSSAFSSCESLTNVVIGNSVTSIGYNAFGSCESLKKVEFRCAKIGAWFTSLNSSTSIEEVVIGNSVTSIAGGAFKDYSSLTNIHLLGETPPSVESNTFAESQYATLTIYVPQGALDAYQAADVWKNFWDIREEGTTETPDEEVKKCATPVITYSNSGLDIASETDGSEIHTYITCSDANSYNGDRIDLSATYSITTYATKSGYLNSGTATATLCWIAVNGSSEENGIIEVEAMPVLITCNNGTINICGGKEGAEVVVYTTSGVAVGNATITNGNATISTELAMGEIAVVNIAGKGIKIVMQ